MGDEEQVSLRQIEFEDDIELLEEVEVEELARDNEVETRDKEVGVGSKRKATQKRNTSGTGTGKRSKIWNDFIELITEGPGDPPQKIKKAKCIHCGTVLMADPVTCGTSALGRHITSCLKKRQGLALGGQTKLNLQPCGDGAGMGTLSTWKFDQEACRMRLCEMIIRDELPFRFVEREGFKRYTESLCPQFKIPSRHTIRADCVKLFMERKIYLKSFFRQKGMGRVSITTDCWTSINNTNFICVTAHCIDRDWVLHKKIIAFKKICSHKGDDLGASIISSLEDWGLKRVLCCTMDNASANDGAIKHMISVFDRWKTNVLGGKYMHMRCAAHIINLVVSEVDKGLPIEG